MCWAEIPEAISPNSDIRAADEKHKKSNDMRPLDYCECVELAGPIGGKILDRRPIVGLYSGPAPGRSATDRELNPDVAPLFIVRRD
jgi:hypothetical protein